MKILIATDNYYPNVNGASYFAQRLAFYLKKNFQKVLIVSPSRRAYPETFEHDGVEVFGVPSLPLERLRVPFPVAANLWVGKAVKQFKPDVIHIQSHFAIGRNAASAGKQLGIPVVGTNHFMPENLVHYFHLPQGLETTLKNLGWSHCLNTLNRLDAITSPTHIAAGLLEQVGIKKPVRVISNGIDLQIFKPSNDGAYLRQRYNIPAATPVMLYVGRLDKEKNINLILRALKLVTEKLPATLVVAGTGAERENLEKLAIELGLRQQVIFTGFVPDQDLPNLYAIADCFVIAGTAELQSIVTMEAMATALPVLAVRATALPELVVDGDNGFLFELEETGDVAKKMQLLLGNAELRKQMGQNSLKNIQLHNMQSIIEQFQQLYEQVSQKV